MQEVLGALHGHLGSGQAAEVTAALGALLSLAHMHSQALLQHVGFASNLLDCLPSLTQPQVHQVTPTVNPVYNDCLFPSNVVLVLLQWQTLPLLPEMGF